MPESFSRDKTYTCHVDNWDYNLYSGNLNDHWVSSFTDTYESESRAFLGSTTPNYRSYRDANRSLPTTACSDLIIRAQGDDVVQKQYAYIQSTGAYVVKSQRSIKGYLPFEYPPSPPSGLEDEAWSRLRNKVLDQDFNAPVFLAEAGKTVSLIANTATRIFKAYRALKRGRPGEVAVHLGLSPGTVHNTWLEYKYGWMPLLADVHGAAATLAKVGKTAGDISTFSASSRNGGRYTRSTGTLTTGVFNHNCKAWVTVRVRNPSTTAMNSIGALNPLSVAWELVPFSFVADWFINIGDCIKELSAFNGVDILAGGTGLRTSAAGTVKEIHFSPWDVPRTSVFTFSKYDRYPGAIELPTLRLRSNPLSIERILTSAALIRQVASR